MAIRIDEDFMTLTVDGEIVATARCARRAADYGNSAWTVSTYPTRPLNRDQAITALSIAERLAVGFGDDDPFVKGWREELFP
jgi:hypothetical protein